MRGGVKLTATCEMDGWETILSLSFSAYFRSELLVLGEDTGSTTVGCSCSEFCTNICPTVSRGGP